MLFSRKKRLFEKNEPMGGAPTAPLNPLLIATPMSTVYRCPYTKRRHRIQVVLTNSTSCLTLRPVSVCALPRHHRLSSAAQEGLSTTGFRAFPVAASSKSRRRNHCLLSGNDREDISSSVVLSPDHFSALATASWFRHSDCSRSFHLLISFTKLDLVFARPHRQLLKTRSLPLKLSEKRNETVFKLCCFSVHLYIVPNAANKGSGGWMVRFERTGKKPS